METSYNDIPYIGRVHHQTHIENLAMTAKLFQLEFPDIQQCRVLELGCGDGSNIVNMAYAFPNSHFVGVDGSSVHIERGQGMVNLAGLKNVELYAMDILNIDEDMGQFDFIICHGVFSWVPEKVRKKILEIGQKMLTPTGIGYISYNAYPAWKQHEMLRDMMRFHAFRMEDTEEQIAQARALVQFLGEHIYHQSDSYGQFVQSQVEFISSLTGEYLFHEYLETYNQPFWFYEFVNMLSEHDLLYLGDTDLSAMINIHWPTETRDILNSISPTQYELEQYMDMLRCRRFRCSLFIHNDRDISRTIEPAVFKDIYLSYKACPKWNIEDESETLETSLGRLLVGKPDDETEDSTLPQHLLYQIVFENLHNAWPKRLHFDELISKIEEQQQSPITEQDIQDLMELFQSLYLQGTLQIHLHNPPIANSISERPMLSPMARHQATYQEVISTQLHDMVVVKDTWVRTMSELLDGEHSLREIADILYDKMLKEELPPLEIGEDGAEPSSDPQEIIALMMTRMTEIMHSFLENGALVS